MPLRDRRTEYFLVTCCPSHACCQCRGEPGGWRAKRKEREGRIIGVVERTGRDVIVGMNTPEKSEKREEE